MQTLKCLKMSQTALNEAFGYIKITSTPKLFAIHCIFFCIYEQNLGVGVVVGRSARGDGPVTVGIKKGSNMAPLCHLPIDFDVILHHCVSQTLAEVITLIEGCHWHIILYIYSVTMALPSKMSLHHLSDVLLSHGQEAVLLTSLPHEI